MGSEREAAGLGLEETELSLGLPGGVKASASGKRAFTETEAAETTIDLKLKLQTSVGPTPQANQVADKKRGPAEKSNAETCARPPASKYNSFFFFFRFHFLVICVV
jgi:hypothetical protein